MRRRRILFIVCCVFHLASIGQLTAADEPQTIRWRRHDIDRENPNSACAVLDVNGDGKLDLVAGGFWYEGPSWKRHFLRDVEVIRGRNDDYSNLPLDVSDDGRLDLVSVNYRSKSLYWVEHPGDALDKPDQAWARHVIDTPGPSETGRLHDIDGDGRLDVLPNGTDFAAWYEVVLEKAEDDQMKPRWIKHELPQELAGHGIGFGDLSGDGRGDVVGPRGWAEAPEDRRAGRWIWHAGPRLHHDASIPILVHDVDADGDTDLIWGRGHNIGLYWIEQTNEDGASGKPEGSPQWKLHAIDTSWSQAHAILLADIDGDGSADLIAGKRYMGHDGNDSGEYDPLVIAWYKFDPRRRTWQRQVICESMEVAFGVDPKAADVDADGDNDLLCADRSGLYLLKNVRRPSEAVEVRENPDGLGRPSYEDHANLLVYKDHDGKSQPVKSPTDWAIRRAHVLANMQLVMGPLPGVEHRVPLDVEYLKQEDVDSYVRHSIRYRADPNNLVPALLLVPKELKKPAPAMLCLHPTSDLGKLQVAGIDGKPSRFYAHELAQRGYVCLVPDYPSFGDYKGYDFAKDELVSGTMRAIWDNIRGADLLESLDYVDGDHIGAIGHSLGGHNSLFTATFDQRIRAVVTSCGFTAFGDYYGGDLRGWTSDRYMPRIRDEYDNDPRKMPFDFHEILAAHAPRPVFICAPLHDDNFDVGGVRKCVAAAAEIYQLRGAEKNLHVAYPDCAHDFPDDLRAQAYEWLDGHLKR